jgi:hypothetical protein
VIKGEFDKGVINYSKIMKKKTSSSKDVRGALHLAIKLSPVGLEKYLYLL